MGNSVAKVPVPVDQIQLIPGNVLVYIDPKDANKAQSVSKGDGATTYHNLIRGQVVRTKPIGPNGGGYPEARVSHLKWGDEVLVRARKGYPIDTGEGLRLFVFNEWDVAIKLGGRSRQNGVGMNGVGGGEQMMPSSAPPSYEDKQWLMRDRAT